MTPSPASLDITVAFPGWRAALDDVEEVCRRAALAAFAAGVEGWEGPAADRLEISLVLSDDDAVQVLNHGYRGIDKPTNVLSFAALDDEETPVPDEGPVLLGDVIVACQTAVAEAQDEGKSLHDHLSHLVVHGILHLMGFDHQDDDEAQVMEDAERTVLAGLGIASPYDAEEKGHE